ncbi:NERD domain-containing protein [Massilia sp. B-10]|nr:NERD domain-containing protein [Massilia sp. B-10]
MDQILRGRQPPTEGELYLLQYLHDHFDPDADVFFQPCFNGDRPDIVLVKKDIGVIIIEVKDWDLAHYCVDEKNQWSVKKGSQPLQDLLRKPSITRTRFSIFMATASSRRG